jgi:hypothetical protein
VCWLVVLIRLICLLVGEFNGRIGGGRDVWLDGRIGARRFFLFPGTDHLSTLIRRKVGKKVN